MSAVSFTPEASLISFGRSSAKSTENSQSADLPVISLSSDAGMVSLLPFTVNFWSASSEPIILIFSGVDVIFPT